MHRHGLAGMDLLMTDENPEKDAKTGKFLPGNRFWEARSTHGRAPKFASPEDIRSAAVEYFEWVDGNPLGEEKLFSYEGSIVRGDMGRMQAMTLKGLCIFLDISFQGWSDYRLRPDFIEVCEWVESVIYHQKFTGAAAGLLNPSIIARDLGLSDKTELTGKDGGPVEMAHVTDRDRAKAAAAILAKGLTRAKADGGV